MSVVGLANMVQSINLIDYFLKSSLLIVRLKEEVKIDDGVIIAFWLHPIPFRTRT